MYFPSLCGKTTTATTNVYRILFVLFFSFVLRKPAKMNGFTEFILRCILIITFIGPVYILAKKEVQTLGERVHKLTEMSSKRAVIRLNGDKFHQFIKATPKNYSFIVMLTAMQPTRQCAICWPAYEEFKLVANSWKYPEINNNKIFFGMVDFDDVPEVFGWLRINSAPVIMHFPEKGIPEKDDSMDIQRLGFQAEAIAKWISEQTDVQIKVFRPPNYSGAIAMIILFVLLGGLLYMRRNNLDFLFSRTTWGLVSLCIVFVMTSGQMWNHIRGAPFMQHSIRGNIGYIHGNSGGQFIVETYIVIILSAAVTLGMILLQEAASSRTDSKKPKILAVVGLALVAVFFSLLVSMFRMKAKGYPYSFLFK